MSEKPDLHIADEYDRIVEEVTRAVNLRVTEIENAPFIPEQPRWKDSGEPRLVLPFVQIPKNGDIKGHFSPASKRSAYEILKEDLSETRERLRLAARETFMVPDGESGIQQMLATPYGVAEELQNGINATKYVFSSIVEQTGEVPRKVLVASVAVATLFSSLNIITDSNNRSEQAMGPDGVIGTELIVDRSDKNAKVTFSPENQDIKLSEIAAEQLLGVPETEVVIDGNKIKYIGQAMKSSDEELIAATMEAQRPDLSKVEVVIEPKVEKPKFPTTPEEKFSAEIIAIEDTLKHAIKTGGDLGPLTHMIANSPIFQPRYDLPGDLENGTIRVMPPANLLNIDGLKYEFSQGAPDKERMATSNTVALTLATAYAYNQSITANEEYSEKYGDSCIRVGDLSADKDHVSHFGSQVDITSVLECELIEGHEIANGPVFWINHTVGGMDQEISNPVHDEGLDNLMLHFIASSHIEGKSITGKILYSKPDTPDRVVPHDNHSNHIHINVAPPLKDLDLKDFAEGGDRPERNLDQLRGQISADYNAGLGVEGISIIPKSKEEIVNSNENLTLELSPDAVKVLDGFMPKIEELKSVYQEIEKQTGVPWQLMAALHNREGGNRSDASMFAGEKIGSINPDHDTPIGSSLLENGINAAEHFKLMSNSIYGVEVSSNMTNEQLQYAFLAYNRGNMYKNAKDYIGREMTPQESPYVMNGLVGYENMLWPNKGNYSKSNSRDSWGEPNSVQGKPNKQLGAISVAIGLGFGSQRSQPSQNRILVLTGDSLTVGLDENHANIQEMDIDFGVNVIALNARGGRPLSRGQDSGMDSIEGLITAGKIQDADVVYLAYGTNFEEKIQFEQNLRKAIARIHEVSDAKVVMPLIFSQVKYRHSRNEIIMNVAKETGSEVINPGDGLSLSDGLHPSPDGYREMAKRILDEVSKMDFTPEPINTAPLAQPAVPVEPSSDKPVETIDTPEEQDSADNKPITEFEKNESNETPEETENKQEEIWFSEQSARKVYEVWFTEKEETESGEIIFKVNEQSLDNWMTSNVKSEEREGKTVYQIDFNNVPTETERGE